MQLTLDIRTLSELAQLAGECLDTISIESVVAAQQFM